MERYVITGAQIGVIRASLKARKTQDVIKELRHIEDKQFIGNSANDLDKDVIELSKLFYNTRNEVYDKQFKGEKHEME